MFVSDIVVHPRLAPMIAAASNVMGGISTEQVCLQTVFCAWQGVVTDKGLVFLRPARSTRLDDGGRARAKSRAQVRFTYS